jgi:hypothetical protein
MRKRYSKAHCDLCIHRGYVTDPPYPCKLGKPTRVRFADDADSNPYADNYVVPDASNCADWERRR